MGSQFLLPHRLQLVIFVVALIVAQSAIFSYNIARRPFNLRPPNTVAAMSRPISGRRWRRIPISIWQYLNREYRPDPAADRGDEGWPRRLQPAGAAARRHPARRGRCARRDDLYPGAEPRIDATVVMAPIQVAGELRGMAVLPPLRQGSPVVRDVGRILSVPGTVLLIVATTIVAAFIFAPARRRLQALEAATVRLARRDLSARAPEGGGDEIAHVAGAFNRMALDLAARDEALRTVDRLRRQMLADVSHELKTPLTAMRGYLETLRMTDVALDAATRERYFETIERETLRLDRIVQDLLDLARLENGVGAMHVRMFAIGKLFEHVVHHQSTKCGCVIGSGSSRRPIRCRRPGSHRAGSKTRRQRPAPQPWRSELRAKADG
jgi:signal transduction histidine kinase